jgi:hypothetical protein
LCGTQRFITASTRSCHLSLSWTISVWSMSLYPTSWRSFLILPSHLQLGLPSGLFPSGIPTITLYTPLHFSVYATCTDHLIILNFIIRIIFGENRSLSYSLCSFLHSHVTSALLAQLLSLVLYSQTSSAYVPPSVWATSFTPIKKTTGKNFMIFKFLDSQLETNDYASNDGKHSLTSSCS